ncbi:peptidoglycan-binding protein LysM [Oricola sp.]|uniref:peptidoglycan-binding protein LysM n=1 Tax=Oricola sp. TaxID=1979950 RepID=UPI0025F02FB3|nr:peptidoglycan-binding protein LysM [Oricola sp.]MCI5077558.1 peptidoglycan-binding protein LysM [Oricola sp.]
MGIFDFVKSAGKKLGFGDDDEENAKELKKELDSHKLGTDGVEVEVKGDTAIIKGAVEDQSIFEKAVVAVGNTLGISKVEASELKVAETPAKDPKFHTVEKSDTLWAIAEKAYGNGSKYQTIFEANTPMLTHPDKIYPGQVLRIPELD